MQNVATFFGNDLSEVPHDHLVLIPAHNMLFILLLFLITALLHRVLTTRDVMQR